MAKQVTLKTAQTLNKNIKIMGLEGFQVLIVVFLIIITFMINKILSVLILIILAVILSKINTEIKNGNPAPVQSFLILRKTKKNLIDQSNVLNKIYINGKQ